MNWQKKSMPIVILAAPLQKFCPDWIHKKLTDKRYINGHDIVVTPAPEVNDIIWENLEPNNKCKIWLKKLLIYLIMIFIFAINYLLQLALKSFQLKLYNSGQLFLVNSMSYIISVVIIPTINWLVKFVYISLADYETPVSRSEKDVELTWKIIFTQLINAVVIII